MNTQRYIWRHKEIYRHTLGNGSKKRRTRKCLFEDIQRDTDTYAKQWTVNAYGKVNVYFETKRDTETYRYARVWTVKNRRRGLPVRVSRLLETLESRDTRKHVR